ncbi:MAG: CHAP domain-containing protein [Proteobacteria bacterium]|nr:CHAP domain-containing protein [Pseudomonadota bacterium]
MDKAVKHLDDNAYETSQGQCAKYVRQAIEAGGVTIPNRPLYAKDYGPKLMELGFKKIGSAGYSPQKGDIVVLQPPKGQSAGHIQIYNGKIWESDFKQSGDIYPGPTYRKEKVAYEIYRP